MSPIISVISGAPQGSMLGPLLFLIFIDDAGSGFESSYRLFTEDIKLLRVIKIKLHDVLLQNDLSYLSICLK